MSLDFNLTNTKLEKTEDGGRVWADCTEAIIWDFLTAQAGPDLTEQNVEEFYGRVVLACRLGGYDQLPRYTLDELRVHIGLSTNVFPRLTDAQWWKRQREINGRDVAATGRNHSRWLEEHRAAGAVVPS